MTGKKYKLLRATKLENKGSVRSDATVKMRRIVALRDIPEHGVKKGDFGGYVSDKYILSHEGSCWIGGDAMVNGNITVKDSAYIGGNTIVVSLFSKSRIIFKDSAVVEDNAEIMIVKYKSEDSPTMTSTISGFTKISGDAIVHSLGSASGDVKIYENAYINRATSISGETEVYGSAKVQDNSVLEGKTKVFDQAHIAKNVTLTNCIVRGKAQIGENESFSGEVFEKEAIFRTIKKEIPEIVIGDNEQDAIKKDMSQESSTSMHPAPNKTNRALALLGKLQKDIASYETDIVKIIKYPVMTDRTNDYTMDMVIALSNAEELSADPEDQEFKDSVKELQKRFLAAESNALKIASTLLTEDERKKTEKAKDLLAIAANEGSSENEKKVSFKQAFKQLEGVIVVPEVAVDTFRVKIGLQELEM